MTSDSTRASQRRPLFAANWKMNLLRADVESFMQRLGPELPATRPYDVLIAPSSPWLPLMAAAAGELGIRLAAQDIHPSASGAHTGDLAAPQAADAGASWALCGHSERRSNHHENDELVASKAVTAQAHGLGVLFCFGEQLQDREANQVSAVLVRQLAPLLAAIQAGSLTADPTQLVLAYEPVWAIGTGKTATPEIANETQTVVRSLLREQLGPEASEALSILYGGSVKPANAAELLRQPQIDGFLIGGASLDPGSFLDIIVNCGF